MPYRTRNPRRIRAAFANMGLQYRTLSGDSLRPCRPLLGFHPHTHCAAGFLACLARRALAAHKKMVNLSASSIRPMPAKSVSIPAGDAGTAATVAHMWKLIAQGKKSPLVREMAVRIIRSARIAAHDSTGEARALYEWALRSIRFTRDIRGRETLHSADEILRLGVGDCDDFSILLLSLAQSLGAPARIVTISHLPPDAETGTPGEFTHVFPEVLAGGRWRALDCARRNPAFDRRPAHCTRWQAWDDPSEDEGSVEYLNFYVGPHLTVGTPRQPFARTASMGAWGAPAKMTSAARSQTYVAHPQKKRSGTMKRLGQDWTALLPSLISSGAGAATQILAASKGAATAAPGLQTGVAPQNYNSIFGGGYAPGVYSSGGGFLGMSPTTLLIGAALIGGLMLMSRRG